MHRWIPFVVVALVLAPAAPAVGDSGSRPEVEIRIAAERLDELTNQFEGLGPDAPLPAEDARADLAAALSRLDFEVAAAHLAAAEALGDVMPGGEGFIEDVPAPASALAIYLDAAETADPAPVLDVLAAWWRLQEASARAEAARERFIDGLPSEPVVRVCPVDGPFEIGDTWDEPRPWGRTHKGVDLHADRGTPLVALESGTVVQHGWHRAGGLGVYLLGETSGDVYYYSHLDGIVPDLDSGDRFEAGELLGWVGWTGNADVSHLHLGWIPHHGPGWISLDGLADPLPMVVSACG